jgi:hypothetical protein
MLRGFGLLSILFTFGLFACVTSCQSIQPPLEEYSIARAAIEAAKSSEAPRHSPGFWHQADESYRKGRMYFSEREWGLARDEFIKSRLAAEKAENSARLIRQKNGDVL